MKQNRFTEEQIVKALQDLEAGRKTTAEKARELGCSESTIYLWYQQMGLVTQQNDTKTQELKALVEKQRAERKAFLDKLAVRQQQEAIARQAHFRSGFGGLWDRLTGKRSAFNRKTNKTPNEPNNVTGETKTPSFKTSFHNDALSESRSGSLLKSSEANKKMFLKI
jgi:hypothetical protein